MTEAKATKIMRKLVAKHLGLWALDPSYPVDLTDAVRKSSDDTGQWAGESGLTVIYCESGLPSYYDDGGDKEWEALYLEALTLGLMVEPYNAAVVCVYAA